MIKALKKNLFKSIAYVVMAVAMTGVSAYSMVALYEPDIPEALKNDTKVK